MVPVGIIEAQRLFAPFLSQLLSEAGYTVVASVETVAVDELGRSEPHVVLFDIDFDSDALGAIRLLRAVLPQAAICVYTGTVQDDWEHLCRLAGADVVITKLATPAEIVALVGAALRERTSSEGSLRVSRLQD